ncbi:uncharacterized protein YALI1_F30852g [Yarrowia lipolytica]|uniref:Uncharacterized protein n=1 Tax=Yarrowia lipolytica TaxID=4952 RepID=A0A1D8NPQ7_YARLL|nr:hypothetical protein YALI1_F30852g [Yarrowia lipolytica]
MLVKGVHGGAGGKRGGICCGGYHVQQPFAQITHHCMSRHTSCHDSNADIIPFCYHTNTRACGKSSLTLRLTDDTFSEFHDVTIAAEIGSKVVDIDGKEKMKLQIWDTAGQEHFRAVTRSYFRNAAGCLLVYDITRPKTFANVQMWLGELRDQADEDIIIMLVGNKTDVGARQVEAEEARKWADENGLAGFIETSAKTGDQVLEAYQRVAQKIHSNIKTGKTNINDKRYGVRATTTGGAQQLNLDEGDVKKSGYSACC